MKRVKQKLKKPVTCEHCENCIYLGDGDFLCDELERLVIEDWNPVEFPCEDYKE